MPHDPFCFVFRIRGIYMATDFLIILTELRNEPFGLIMCVVDAEPSNTNSPRTRWWIRL